MVERFLPVIPAEAGMTGVLGGAGIHVRNALESLFEGRGVEGVSGREEVGTSPTRAAQLLPGGEGGSGIRLDPAFGCFRMHDTLRGVQGGEAPLRFFVFPQDWGIRGLKGYY